MTEKTVMVPLTARFNSYKCDKTCEHRIDGHGRLMAGVSRYVCRHFSTNLAEMSFEGKTGVTAIRCDKCIELFGGLDEG